MIIARVVLWGRTIGAVALAEGKEYATFEYDPAFVRSGIQVSPLVMPLGKRVFEFPMTFNIVARNQDDHVKNIAFLMDRSRWSLAPAFDVTYSFNAKGKWTSRHQMSMNGKCDDFTHADFRECGKTALLKRGRAEAILDEVRSAVSKWRRFAEQAGIAATWRDSIKSNLRVAIPRK